MHPSITMSKENLIKSNSQNGKNLVSIIRLILIVGIILTSLFIIYIVINPEPGYVSIGVLNSDKKSENYPTEVNAGDSVTLYATVGNYMGENLTFSIYVLKGDHTTQFDENSGSDGALIRKLSIVTLQHGEEWESDAQVISFLSPGSNQVVIFELWKIVNEKETFHDVVFIRLDVS